MSPLTTTPSTGHSTGPSKTTSAQQALPLRPLPILVLLLVVALTGCAKPEPARVGAPAPGLSVRGLDGARVSLEDFNGKPVVLSFWATWCQPCRPEFPVLGRLHEEGRAAVLAVSLDQGGEGVVSAFAEKESLAYPIALGDQEAFQLFSGVGIPHTVVLDADHTVVAFHRKAATYEELTADLGFATGP